MNRMAMNAKLLPFLFNQPFFMFIDTNGCFHCSCVTTVTVVLNLFNIHSMLQKDQIIYQISKKKHSLFLFSNKASS